MATVVMKRTKDQIAASLKAVKTTPAEIAAATDAAMKAKYKKPAAVKAGPIKEVPIADIAIDGTDHRMEDPKWKAKIQEMAATLEAHGQLQPIQVREPERKNGKYLVVFGRRRLEAAKSLGWKSIRAEIVEADQAAAIERASIENIQREGLDSMEESEAVSMMLDQLAGGEVKITGEAAIAIVAERIGKSATWVRDRSVLARLGPEARKLVRSGRLPLAQARELAKLADHELQADIAEEAARHEDGTFGRTVEWVRSHVAEKVHSLKVVPWELAQKFAGKPACATCEHNSANAADLFIGDKKDDVPEVKEKVEGTGGATVRAGVCLKPSCFKIKQAEAGKGIVAATKKAVMLLVKEGVSVAEAVGEVIADGIKASSVMRAVRAEVEKPAAGAKKKEKPKAYAYGESPEDKAKDKLSDAREKIFRGIETAMFAAARKDPLKLVAMVLLNGTNAWWNATRHSSPKVTPQLSKFIKHIKSPTTSALSELVRDRFQKESLELPNSYGDVQWEVIKWLADAIDHELPAEPKLADFLKEEKAEASERTSDHPGRVGPGGDGGGDRGDHALC